MGEFASGRRWLVWGGGSLLLVALSCALLAFFVQSGSVRGTLWSERVAACPVPDPPVSADGLNCLGTAWVDAYRAGDLDGFYRAVSAELAVRPQLDLECHNAGHDAGKAALRLHDVARVLQWALASADPCAGGFGHGALDAFGARERSPDQVDAVAAVCREAAGEVARASCADGLGHAAWQSTGQDPEATVLWCQRLAPDAQAQATCVAGVVMQAVKIPLNGAPDVSAAEASREVPRLCERMRRAGLSELPLRACFAEVANAFVTELADPTLRWAQSLGGVPVGGAPASWAEVRPLWARALSRCEAVGDHAGDCRLRMSELVKYTTLNQPEATGLVCSVFSASGLREHCLSFEAGVTGFASDL